MYTFTNFDRWMGKAYHQVGNIVGITIGLFAVAISIDLILRLLQVGNLAGMQEIVEYALFAGVFLAAPWVLRLGAHIRVDVLISAMPSGLARNFERLLDTFGFLICCTLTWYGAQNLAQAYKFNAIQRAYFNVSEWWLLTIFVISFGLLAVEFLSRLIRQGLPPEATHSADGGV